MKLGKLEFVPVEERLDLVAAPVKDAIDKNRLKGVLVAEIDPSLADTAAFCQHYDIRLEISANCVVIEAKRAEKTWYGICMILATDRIDVNNIVRRHLDARKISFASMDKAVSLSGMEYGGITPIGLPAVWPILVDESVAKADHVVIGSGIRGSKLVVPGMLLAALPNATAVNIKKTE